MLLYSSVFRDMSSISAKTSQQTSGRPLLLSYSRMCQADPQGVPRYHEREVFELLHLLETATPLVSTPSSAQDCSSLSLIQDALPDVNSISTNIL